MCDAPDPIAGSLKNCNNCSHWRAKKAIFRYVPLENGSVRQVDQCDVKNELTGVDDSCDDWRAIKKHELKCWPEYFEAALNNDKLFEARIDDRDYQVGDVLQLREWDPKTREYTGRYFSRKITYILRASGLNSASEAIRQGYVVMSIEPKKE